MVSSASSALADQELIGYWDLNRTTLIDAGNRTAGISGNLEATFAYIGIGSLRLSSEGTLENAYGASPAGTALEFHGFADVVAIGHFGATQLDFRGYTAPTISFAHRRTSLVTLFDEFWLEYRIGHGDTWTRVVDIEQPGRSYQIFSHTFTSGELDGQNDVSIRVRFREVVSMDASFLVDNLQITAQAIPEPGSVALMGGAVLLMGARLFRRKAGQRG